jgi:hypothetical protein
MIVVRAGHQKLFDGGKVLPMMSQGGANPAGASGGTTGDQKETTDETGGKG